jgi:hypothetical protein
MQWRTSSSSALKWASMAVDAAAFFWSTRACTNRDTVIATVAIAIAYIGFPTVLKRCSANIGRDMQAESGERYARIVALAAVAGLVCVLVSGGITEL